jgi:hypothetical protein
MALTTKCLLSLVMLCHRVLCDTTSEKTPMEKKKKEKKRISLSNRDYFLKKIDPAHHQKAMALWLGFGFSNPKPGQSHHEAIFTARLGLAYLGLAWPGSWPQAGPGTSLDTNRGCDAASRATGFFFLLFISLKFVIRIVWN